MADGGWHTKDRTQRLDPYGNAKRRSADAVAYFVKKKEHGAQNGKLEGILDWAVDGDIHIEINVKQQREQKGETGEAKGGMCGVHFGGEATFGEEKERRKQGEDAKNGAKYRNRPERSRCLGESVDQKAEA